MVGKLMVLIVATFQVVACAKPNYEEARGPGPDPHSISECEAKFSSGACVGIAWEKVPRADEYGTFVVYISKVGGSGEPVLVDEEGVLAVVLWMPAMGHGSSPVKVSRIAVGTYRISEVFFSMPGDWEIRFHLKRGKETLDQAIVPFYF